MSPEPMQIKLESVQDIFEKIQPEQLSSFLKDLRKGHRLFHNDRQKRLKKHRKKMEKSEHYEFPELPTLTQMIWINNNQNKAEFFPKK